VTLQFCPVYTECTFHCINLHVVTWANRHLQALPFYRLTYTAKL